MLAWIGLTDDALGVFEGVAPEFAALPPLGLDPWLASVEGSARYRALLREVEARRAAFREQFYAATGDRPPF